MDNSGGSKGIGLRDAPHGGGRGGGAAGLQLPAKQKTKLKKTHTFYRHDDLKLFRDVFLCRNQLMTSKLELLKIK